MPRTLQQLYQLIANEEDSQVCNDISEDACRSVPHNFFAILIANTLTKLGDALSSPKTVLAWLLSYVGAPGFLVALLVPIRESGSMVPQIFIGGYIRRLPIRKTVWITGSMLQFAAVALMGVSAAFLTGARAGWSIVVCLLAFSLARALCSVSSKDVLGKTIPKRRRGRLGGIAAGVSGVLSVAAGLLLFARNDGEPTPLFYGALLAGAGLLWLAAALAYGRVKEFPGETGGGRSAAREAWRGMSLLRTDARFRTFVITRALFLCSALSAPYYVLLARERADVGAAMLGAFVVASGLASSVSAPLWGFMADASSRRVMLRGATLAAAIGLAVFAVATWAPSLGASRWVYPSAFFLLGIAHSGVRAGRKTYIVDMAGGTKRTDYVAVSNTVIGVVLLLLGLIGGVVASLPSEWIILGFSFLGGAGVALGRTLPEVE